ncbi:hypothetical protein M426DRAFT_324891 [Hypoxylon sp. CI-4A]|nr:hypothetical protein M426DRAFT_324891 [Hypoxylon sp. CI-4A]
MATLPEELLSRICFFLHKNDVKKFRLASKRFSAVGAEFLRANMFVRTTNQHFEKLVKFSETPLASGLRSLEFVPVISRVPDLQLQEFDDLGNPAYTIDPDDTFREYVALAREQAGILEANGTYNCFVNTLPRFPRLREIIVHFEGGWFHPDPRRYLPFNQLYPGAFRYMILTEKAPEISYSWPSEEIYPDYHPVLISSESQPLTLLLDILSDAGAKIESLMLNDIDWHFFNRDDAALRALFEPVADLKHLSLTVDDYFHNVRATNREERGPRGTFNSCHPLMRTGVLRRCLPTLTKLRTLKIGFNINLDPDNLLSTTPLNQIIQPGFTWTYLRELKLTNIKCERQELMDLLLRHKETLQELALEDILLLSTSWIILLPQIRTELYLTKARLSKYFIGRYEDDRVVHSFWLYNNPMSDAVNAYLEKGGATVPDMESPFSAKNDEAI